MGGLQFEETFQTTQWRTVKLGNLFGHPTYCLLSFTHFHQNHRKRAIRGRMSNYTVQWRKVKLAKNHLAVHDPPLIARDSHQNLLIALFHRQATGHPMRLSGVEGHLQKFHKKYKLII